MGEMFRRGDEFILRTANIADAQMISRYFCANKQALRAWEPERDAEFFTEVGWQKKLLKLQELHRLGLGYYMLITDRADKQMLGTVSFSSVTRFPVHSCNVGYSLAKSEQGKGLMTKALTLAVQYMFEIENMHRVCAAYMPHNKKSAAVLSRVGFEREGFSQQYILIDGQWQDHILTAMINPDWKKRD
ncbi:ribosomal protein S5-alanine N-acetyltransferase [Vibrio sp. WXL103]|uniref:ribosomal protein S5-alanine N-acetyltransferase n=1 Tax=unclassified Vibrio TaxID=2614977 RepID=UPI003EC5652D